MNQFTAQELVTVAELRKQAASLVAYERPEDQPAARLGAFMAAAEEEVNEQCQSSTVMLVRKSLVKEAAKYTKPGAFVPVDLETTAKLVTLLGQIFEGYTNGDQHNPVFSHGEQE